MKKLFAALLILGFFAFGVLGITSAETWDNPKIGANEGGVVIAESQEVIIESDYPYPNNYGHTWTIKREGAKQIRIHFKK